MEFNTLDWIKCIQFNVLNEGYSVKWIALFNTSNVNMLA